MKVKLLILACLLALFENTACTGSKEKQFDISLEGPWILYVDHDLASWPVLVAIAPNSQSVGYWQHQPTTVSAGDGYLLADFTEPLHQPLGHAYCLTLDDECARKGPDTLKSSHYPDVEPLQVSMPSGHQQWINAVKGQLHATALILPMPDSYSSDGVWPAHFAAKWDPDPKNYGKSEQHSIGVQLHYKKGPAHFNLRLCDSFDVTNCGPLKGTNSNNTFVVNSGTIRIAMKAPLSTNVCDPHVRRIYPQMMQIVGATANQDKAVIDPAHGVQTDGISGRFDDDFPQGWTYPCLAHDAQSPNCDKTVSGTVTRCDDPPPQFPVPAVLTYGEWLETVRDLRDTISSLGQDKQSQHKLAPIAAAVTDEYLKYPRISKLDLLHDSIQPLIDASYSTFELNIAKKRDSHRVPAEAPNDGLDKAADYIQRLHDNSLTKSGNDCKAMVMLAE